MSNVENDERTVRIRLNSFKVPLFWEQGVASSNPAAPTK